VNRRRPASNPARGPASKVGVVTSIPCDRIDRVSRAPLEGGDLKRAASSFSHGEGVYPT
jgi:hypothetical protein